MFINNLSFDTTILAGFFFTFASKCIPTFFSVFLVTKGYSNREIMLISCVFFLGSLTVRQKTIEKKKSFKIFHICATLASIILLLQSYIDQIWIWLFIRFLQGILETYCRNSLYNIIHVQKIQTLIFFMNCGSTAGFLLMCYKGIFSLLFTLTGILLNLSHMLLSLNKNFKDYTHHNKIQIVNHRSLKDIFRNNSILFLIFILSCFLNSTFGTLFPLTLHNYGFTSTFIVQIMFVGSLGHTFVQAISFYLKNLLGDKQYIKYILIQLIILYFLCILSIQYIPILISVCIFFIIGLHISLNGILISVLKNINHIKHDLEIRNALNQIINIGSICVSMIAVIFINLFPRSGIFILWFFCIFTIILLIRKINLFHHNDLFE
jgi:hypothetical protein